MNPACCLDSCLSDQTFRSRHVLHVLAVGPHKQDWRSVAESATANSSVREERRGTEPRVVHHCRPVARRRGGWVAARVQQVSSYPPATASSSIVMPARGQIQTGEKGGGSIYLKLERGSHCLWTAYPPMLSSKRATTTPMSREQRQILSNRQTPIRDYNLWTN